VSLDRGKLFLANRVPSEVPEHASPRGPEDEHLPQDRESCEARALLRPAADAANEPRDEREHAPHESIEEDRERARGLLLLSEDELGPQRRLVPYEERRPILDHVEEELDVMGATVIAADPCSRSVEGLLDAVGHGSEARADLAGDVLEHRDVETFFAAEVVADERLPDVCGVGDGAGAGGVEAVAPEHLDSGSEQRFARRVASRT